MDIHKNAASSPRSRALLVRRVLDEGISMAAAAKAIGISERRGWEWLRRYRSEGEAGLLDRSSRPHRCRTTAARVQRQIVRLRRARLTCRRIARLTGRSCATVARVVGRHGLARLRNLEPRPAVRRYERQHAGELLHIDTKRLARIEGIGHRITGDRHSIKRGVGYEYVHLCIDDATRLVYAELLPCQTWRSAVPFMIRALAWFAARGVIAQCVMSDNGSCYRCRPFAAFCQSAALRHIFTRPYTPRTNGKAERMVQTLLREWAYRFPFRNSRQRAALLAPYLHFYNHHRAHRALGDQPPINRLSMNNVLRTDN